MANVVAIVAGVAIAIFLAGALFGVIVLVATTVNLEDKTTMGRDDRFLSLREEASGSVAHSVRKLTGVGLRVGNPDR